MANTKPRVEYYGTIAGTVRAILSEVEELDAFSSEAEEVIAWIPAGTVRQESGPSESSKEFRTTMQEMRAALLLQVDALADELQQIRAIVYGLPDERSRQLAALYFLEGMTLETIAEAMHYSTRTVIRLKNAIVEAMD